MPTTRAVTTATRAHIRGETFIVISTVLPPRLVQFHVGGDAPEEPLAKVVLVDPAGDLVEVGSGGPEYVRGAWIVTGGEDLPARAENVSGLQAPVELVGLEPVDQTLDACHGGADVAPLELGASKAGPGLEGEVGHPHLVGAGEAGTERGLNLREAAGGQQGQAAGEEGPGGGERGLGAVPVVARLIGEA
jgi:hypothetical protein